VLFKCVITAAQKDQHRTVAPVVHGNDFAHDGFDWGGAAKPRVPLDHTVVYEAHLKGFSRLNERIPERLRGTYAGLAHDASLEYLTGLGITTVGGLLDHSRSKLLNAPGLGTKTRTEVQRRQRQWGKLLREAPLSPLTPKGRAEAREELAQLTGTESAVLGTLAARGDATGLSETALRSVSLDALATLLVPAPNNNRSNTSKVETVRLLLRLPDEDGRLPDIGVWPKQKDVAQAVGLSAGRIPQLLKEERQRWRKHPAVRALREEIIGLLKDLGRVASAVEIADALAVRRGTQLPGREQRRALALAAVRAVVEVEQLQPDEAEFQHHPNRRAPG
jgi:hypothetical protein